MASLFMMSLTSCVNEPMGTVETDFPSADGIATIQEQIESVESSVKDLESLQAALQQQEVEFDGIIESLENHIAALQAGAPQKEGSIATFELQKSLAAEIGAIQAELNDDADNKRLSNLFNALEEGVSSWLGNQFDAYFPLAVSEAKVNALAEGYENLLNDQKNFVEGVASDLKAGLKEGVADEDITSLSASVQESIKEINDLNTKVASVAAEVEDGYRKAIATAFSSQSGLDKDALKDLNETAVAMTKSVDNSLANLNSRIAACEAEIKAIKGRLDKLEEDVEDLKELLSMIQSVTYLADYSGDKIFAYYELDAQAERDNEGRMKRTPTGEIVVDYLVRPASAATALADNTNNLWNNGLKVIGYYADQILLAAVDPSNYIDFTIQNVTVKDEASGVISVTVNNNLKDAFYMKETGAKFALSIQADKTDITSKFVELAPKDNSDKVYLESLTLSDETLTVREMATATLKANINPAGAYDKTLTWTANNENITIDQNGQITGNAVGNSVVTVTTTGTDEWGRTLSATCNVTVISPVKLSGPAYVEVGKTADMTLDYPGTMLIESKEWYTSDGSKATVSNGVVTGVGNTYEAMDRKYGSVTVSCKVNGTTVVSHDIKVVVPQPKSVRINNLGDNVSEITIKEDASLNLGGTILPDASAEYFRLKYQSTSASGLGWIDDNTGEINKYKKTLSPENVYVYIDVLNKDSDSYLAPGHSVRRTILVKVQPYYVESITLPANMTLSPGSTATLTPEFTSDVSGKQPSNTQLIWTSSDSNIVSINETTGEMSAHATGTVTITATTSSGATSSSTPKYATCIVSVKEPVAPIAIGDYYYSDGTWSTSRDNNKTVIGIVFSTANAGASDSHLNADFPNCMNGLVVGLNQYSLPYANDMNWGKNDMENWLVSRGYNILDTNSPCGYGNTKGYKALNAANVQSYGDVIRVDFVNAATTHQSNVNTPQSASSWYIPSYKEMQILKDNMTKVNESLQAAGGTKITEGLANNTTYGGLYWTSTYFGSGSIKAFSTYLNGWYNTIVQPSSEYPVRVVLAF